VFLDKMIFIDLRVKEVAEGNLGESLISVLSAVVQG